MNQIWANVSFIAPNHLYEQSNNKITLTGTKKIIEKKSRLGVQGPDLQYLMQYKMVLSAIILFKNNCYIKFLHDA